MSSGRGRDLEAGGVSLQEHENDQALSQLEERARLIKELTKDIHGEVDSQNKFLDAMAVQMDAARRMLSGTVEKFTKVFSNKNNRQFATVVGSCIAVFLILYLLLKR